MADRETNWRGLWTAGATFLKKLIIPLVVPGAPADGEIWWDTVGGRINGRVNGGTVIIPISTDIAASGLSQEQVEDLLGTLLGADTGDLDWTYTDNGAGAGTFSVVVKASAITAAKMTSSATARVFGRITAGAGAGEELTGANLKTIIGAIANADLATMAAGTVKANITGGVAVPTDVANAAFKTWLAIVPADVAFANAGRVLGRASGAGAGAGTELTGAQLLTIIGAIDATTLGGMSAAAIQAAAVATILNGAGPAYDTLLEIGALLTADDAADAGMLTAIGLRGRFVGVDIPAGASPQNVAHGLALANTGDFTYRIFVKVGGAPEDYEVTVVDGNTLAISDESGGAIPAGRRIFIVAGV